MSAPRLLLASTSPYRRELLARLGVPFDAVRPDCDEGTYAGSGLAPRELAETLAAAKARSVARTAPDAVVIGSDQVCALGARVLGKPGDRAGAIAQLGALQGRTHALLTAVHVVAPAGEHAFVDVSRMRMRALEAAAIARYVEHDRPFDCAGSYKLEAAGIALFDAVDSDDHTAITGLPLLRLCAVLRTCGFALP